MEFGIYEDSANKVDAAVFARNLAIQEKYNVTIKTNKYGFNEAVTYASTQIAANSLDFDVIDEGFEYHMMLASSGYIYDIDSVPVVNTAKHYWMQDVLDDSSIANKNYFLVSYANINTLNATGVVFFNTELIDDLKLESPYDLVRNNEWSYDKMFEMSKLAYKDNGDNVFSYDDTFGSVTTNAVTECMLAGMGGELITKDKDDMPELNLNNEKTIDIITKIVEYWADDSSLHINRYSSYQSPNNGGNLLSDTMLAGRALFMPELLYQLNGFADSDFIIGMLPLPKFDEKQEYYWSYVHQTHGTAFSVPIIMEGEQLQQTGTILEDIAYISYYDIRPVFYDENLKIRRAQDTESSEMLDIIFSHIRVDLGIILHRNGIAPNTLIRNFVLNKNTSFVSSIEGESLNYQAKLDEYVDKLSG